MSKIESLKASLKLTKTGFAGINNQGLKVDRRFFPKAIPLAYNPSLSIPPPMPVKEDGVGVHEIVTPIEDNDSIIDFAKTQIEHTMYCLIKSVIRDTGEQYSQSLCELVDIDCNDNNRIAFFYDAELMGTLKLNLPMDSTELSNAIVWEFFPVPK